MAESLKLQRLCELRNLLSAGRLKQADLKAYTVADIDGRHVQLTDPDALEVLDRRIAAEGGQQ